MTNWIVRDKRDNITAIVVAEKRGEAIRIVAGPDAMREWPEMRAAGWTIKPWPPAPGEAA